MTEIVLRVPESIAVLLHLSSIFLSRLADYGIDTFQLTEEELEREVRLA